MSRYRHPEVVLYQPCEPGHPDLWIVLYGDQATVFNDEDQARDHALSIQKAHPGNPSGLSYEFLNDYIGALRDPR